MLRWYFHAYNSQSTDSTALQYILHKHIYDERIKIEYILKSKVFLIETPQKYIYWENVFSIQVFLWIDIGNKVNKIVKSYKETNKNRFTYYFLFEHFPILLLFMYMYCVMCTLCIYKYIILYKIAISVNSEIKESFCRIRSLPKLK